VELASPLAHAASRGTLKQSRRARLSRLLVPARLLVVGALLIGASVLLLNLTGKHYPVKDWLFWIYLKCWGASLLFFLACVLMGNACLVRILHRTLPLLEHFVGSFAIGAFAFFVVELLVGLVGGLKTYLFFALPLAFVAVGFRDGWRVVQRVRRHLFAARLKRPAGWSLLELATLAAGGVALLLIYAPVLTPENVAYDARWYHLPLAEHYVAAGAVRRFPEGWFFGAYPHLTSFYYAWALLMPASRYFDKVELAAHLEVVFFLVTLAGVPALVRVLMPRTRAHLAWVTVFLFPEIFAYDSSLHVGADHVAALWSIPLLAFLIRGLRAQSPALLGLFALMAAAAIDTKFTAVCVVVLPVLAVAVVCTYRALAGRSREQRMIAVKCLATCAAIGLAATAPFWLKNLIWYGDPLYPKFSNLLHARPATPDYRVPFENWFYAPGYRAPPGWQGVREGLMAMATFSFVPHDWSTFHGDAPLFGSLFTLLLACVPFLGFRPRLWFSIAAVHAGVFAWYEIHHFDRYLQTLLPWIAASTTVCLIAIWQLHWSVRAPLVALVAIQTIWGGDAAFLGNHAMAGSALEKTIDLLSRGLKGDGEQRFRHFETPLAVGLDLPEKAKVLVHEQHIHWGLMRASVNDWQGTQGGISYVRAGSVAGVYDLLTTMGVTHLMWPTMTSHGGDTLGGDLLFFAFATGKTEKQKQYAELTVARMPKARPVVTAPEPMVAMFDCAGHYATGLYRISRLTKSDYDPDRTYPLPDRTLADDLGPPESAQVLHDAGFAVVNARCHTLQAGLASTVGLSFLATRGELSLYGRAD
jgi:hypothetical protein